MNLSKLKVVEIPLADLSGKVHELARINQMHSEEEFTKLKISIEAIGQTEPIKLFRGLIVDGRNRCKILSEMGSLTVKAIVLPHKTSKEELLEVQMASDARRNQTTTQLAIKALDFIAEHSFKQRQAAQRAGVKIDSVKLASAINKRSPMMIDILRRGNKVEIQKNGVSFKSESLKAICDYLREEERRLKVEAQEYDSTTVSEKVRVILSTIKASNLTASEFESLMDGLGRMKSSRSRPMNEAEREAALARINANPILKAKLEAQSKLQK